MPSSPKEDSSFSFGSHFGAWVLLGLGLVCSISLWGRLAALFGVYAILRNVVSKQRDRAERCRSTRARVAEARRALE